MLKAIAAFIFFLSTYFHPLHEVKGTLLTGQDFVRGLIVGTYPAPVVEIGAVDRYYFAPDPSEIQKILKLVKSNMTYVPEVYDCDDYSYWFKGELQRQWRLAGHTAPLPIIQVFAAIKINKTGEIVGHAFNGIIDSTGHVVWIEPQPGEPYGYPSVLNGGKFTFLAIYALWI